MKFHVWDGRTFAVLDKRREPTNGRDPFGMPKKKTVVWWAVLCIILLVGIFAGK
jgi:hypothetical protein